MWDDIDPVATDRAFSDLIANPPPPKPPNVSAWSKVGAFLAAPVQGAATAVNQTARVANAVGSYLDTAANSSQRHDGPFESERMRAQAKAADQARATDEQLRSNVEYWKPDPVTASTASSILFDASRVLTKAAGYSFLGGTPVMAGLTGADEGITTAQQLQDRGVDPGTAAKVGVVHGVTTAASVALPVAGRSLLETAGLVAVGGPGSFMAEQALSKHILETAHYPDIASEFDPFDKVGLGVSVAIPGAIGAAVHAVRARTRAPVSPETIDAAHVSYQNGTVDEAALVHPDDIAGMQAHHDTMVATREALDAGLPVDTLPTAQVDVGRAQQVLGRASERAKIEREAESIARPEPEGVADRNPEVAGMLDAFHSVVDDIATGRRTRGDLAFGPNTPPEIGALAKRVLDRPELYDHAVDHLETISDGVAVHDAARSALAHLDEVAARLDRSSTTPTTHADPDVARAMQIAADHPELPVRLGADPDAPTMTARDFLDHVGSEAERDRVESKAYLAAVNCWLSRGDA